MADVVARGVRFHVQRLGPGASERRPVVFVHGLVMDNLSSFYFTLANPVALQAPVVLWDLRGHGLSERPAAGYGVGDMVDDLAALLAALDLGATPVDLVGNSFGGLVALAFAIAHPHRAGRIALIDAHLGAGGWGEKMAATLGLEGEERDRKIAESFQSWLGRHSERKRTRLAKNAEALVYGTSMVADLRASPTLSDDDLRSLQSPVLALYGEQSDLREEAERLSRLAPRCDLRVLPGCSHSVLWEATIDVKTAIVGFMSAL